jgi:hypothetical protein
MRCSEVLLQARQLGSGPPVLRKTCLDLMRTTILESCPIAQKGSKFIIMLHHITFILYYTCISINVDVCMCV